MKKESYTPETSIKCGKTTDNFEKLQMLCKEEAEKLSTTIEIPNQSTISVSFWTFDFPELICVGKFSKSESDSIIYELDFSESTL